MGHQHEETSPGKANDCSLTMLKTLQRVVSPARRFSRQNTVEKTTSVVAVVNLYSSHRCVNDCLSLAGRLRGRCCRRGGRVSSGRVQTGLPGGSSSDFGFRPTQRNLMVNHLIFSSSDRCLFVCVALKKNLMGHKLMN